ncbi:hypothetical protein LPJ63_003449 [Coemansia sp. RSA 2711]|nr:hypothetical protein LPJ63_003449 [Coemansia sp. RSA 2711]
MPLFSLLKKLVVADDAAAEPTPSATAAEVESPQIPPPPPPNALPPKTLPPKSLPASGPSTPSTHSLRTQVEAEQHSASTASMYRDFTGGGHADAGHWNDPPTVVFKAHKKKPADAASETSSFMVVDSAVTPNATDIAAGTPTVDVPEERAEQIAVLMQKLRAAVDTVSLDTATPLVKRMAEDTSKRLGVLDERLPELDDTLVSSVCAIALLIDKGLLLEAADAHRALMQAGHETELKWLVGIKRVIELRQKTAQ